MTNNKEKTQLLGEYLMTLSPMERAVCGGRVIVISKFIESSFEISTKGYKEYMAINGLDLNDHKRGYLCDFLFFCGVRLGRRRKRRDKIVQRLDKLSEANSIKISSFLAWCDKQRDYSAATIRMKRDHMSMFFRYFNEFNLDNCRDFIATMEHEGKHPKTLNMYMITLRHFGEFVKKPVALKKNRCA